MIRERRLTYGEKLDCICTRLNNFNIPYLLFTWDIASTKDYVVEIHIKEDTVDYCYVNKALLDIYLINDVCFMILQYIQKQVKEGIVNDKL